MTDAYMEFIRIVNNYLSNPNKETAKTFFNEINEFWGNHELDLQYGNSSRDLNDENSIVSDVFELVDRYDECDAIVATDPYCISESELRKRIIEMLPRINNPVYD